ncbi:MAG: hypothetical protein WAO83_20220 [Fuerstiella sp.]
MDFDPTPYNIGLGLKNWLSLVGIIAGLGILLGLVGSFASAGGGGGGLFSNGISSFFKELASISPRRVWALASLTLKEAWRRKALLVFVVFAVLLMFAGWFLTDSNDRSDLQINVHITFMLTTISWLILPVVMFLSCWGIPEDIRIRSLHTVVTKPARRVEVVLGRMLGFSIMSTVILLLMGTVGYIWIERQAPKDLDQGKFLTCRVPVYGGLFFLDRQGMPTSQGLNVGDPWLYRSFVEGNSRCRAVWMFNEVTPEKLGNELRLESRFEAFRTIKGSADTIQQGLEAQYTLVKNMREEAFSSFGVGAGLREVAEALRAGDFQSAAELLDAAAERMQSSPADFPQVDCQQVAISCAVQVVPVLRNFKDADLGDVADAFLVFGDAANSVKTGDAASYSELSRACASLAETVRKRADDMFESMPKLEVPLEPFRVSEYHEGDDFITYPRKLKYVADYEGTARFLAKVVSGISEAGKLADGGELSSGLVDELSENHGVSPVNAELVFDVVKSEIDAGTLKVDGNKVEIADGSSWLRLFDRLVREEKLISRDTAGWEMEADIFDDLTVNDYLRVEVACLNDQMFIGMARADLFLRLPDRSFLAGFSKALLNIGLMLSLVIVLGVTASCVVKGPVSFFFTLTIFVIGQFFHQLMLKIVAGSQEGGGMVESAMLIFQHRNPSVGIDANEGTEAVVKGLDWGVNGILKIASNIIPDFSTFSEASAYIENGFDVPWSTSVLPAIMTFVGFLIPCVIIGAACLKFRELEAK